MLYLVTALYEEALPFFKKYNLKQKTDFPHFELFTGEGVILLITRPGATRAAVALSSVLTAFPPAKEDFLLSIGCAGCALPDMLGKAFRMVRITEAASGRTRYPELLYRCPFPEAEVITQPCVRLESSESEQISSSASFQAAGFFTPLPVLYDMEAAGIYEAAIPYFSCDRLFFLKVVSDALTGLLELPKAVRRTQVTNYIAGILPELTAWLENLACHGAQCQDNDAALGNGRTVESQTVFEDTSSFPFVIRALGTDGSILFTQICTALHLSAASSRQLYQLMLYLTLSGIPYVDSMREFLAVPLAAPCRTKKEGLKYLESLDKYL